ATFYDKKYGGAVNLQFFLQVLRLWGRQRFIRYYDKILDCFIFRLQKLLIALLLSFILYIRRSFHAEKYDKRSVFLDYSNCFCFKRRFGSSCVCFYAGGCYGAIDGAYI